MGLRQVVMALMTWADMCFRKTLHWLKLSNSGDTLKLLVPNHIRKGMSGWTNYPCSVISQEMIGREMGYRGSKSVSELDTVKEQRVDGSYCNQAITNDMQLRCTLMDFERNYQIKIPSYQLKKFKIFYNIIRRA